MSRRQRGGQSAGSGSAVEVIDLTGSPSPPPVAPRSAASSRTDHEAREDRSRAHYDRLRRHRDLQRERERNRNRGGSQRDRERDEERDRRRVLQADVIDLDALPDREPARREESRNYLNFPQPEPHDIELTFAHARVRQPSRGPYDNPGNARAGRSAAGAPAPAAADHNRQGPWFLPPVDPPNFGRFDGALNGLNGLLEMVHEFSLPLSRGFAGWINHGPNNPAAAQGRARDNGQQPPVAPPRNPQNNRDFRAPGNLPWEAVPRFARRDEDEEPEAELQIVGQHHAEDKPIKDAREGFTRSPNSDQAIGCSNCDCELGDSEDGLQKQIWVMKCGHCYCGECANEKLSMPLPRAQRGKKRKLPTCSITGCKQTVNSKKFIWEIYV
ncbi:hypothetical protein ABW21_db0204865 [Orbilia brochopaga]|nr:hypothetical protein ABW21_db0204865 [Drechslerella brochopaga]